MKRKSTVIALSLLATIGIIGFFVFLMNQPTFRFPVSMAEDFVAKGGSDISPQKESEDPWQTWVDEETDKTVKLMLAAREKQDRNAPPVEESQLAKWRTNIRANMTKHADMMKEKYVSPAAMEASGDGLSDEVTVRKVPLEKYTGPQTVESLMEAFDEKYDRPYLDRKVDQKYPRAEWLAMCLDRGAMFGDFGDYSGLMSERWNLVSFEEKGDWVKGTRGVPPTDDWETFKAAYIDRMVWEHQQIYEARQIDPEVFGGLFTGPDGRTYLPGRANRVYVERKGSATFFHGPPLTEKQQWGITLLGIHPKGYEIIYIDENGTILSKRPRPILLPK